MDITKNKRKKSQMKSSDENKKIPNKKKKIMYVNQINRMPFFQENKGFDFNKLSEVLKENLKFEKGYKWAYIVHDLDTLNDGTKKAEHIHIIIQNQNGISMNLLKSILEDNNLSNYEYLHGQFKASEMYLIHDTEQAKKDKKHLYDEHSVAANYDYVSEIKKHRENREKNKNKKSKSDYIKQILDGKLEEKDFVKYDTDEDKKRALFYAENKKKVDDAFDVKRKIMRQNNVCEMLGEYDNKSIKLNYDEEKCKVFWLSGASGSGKSLTSLLLAKAFSKSDDGSDIYISSGNNDIFQDANIKHKIMIFEEFRPTTFNKNIEELFRILDNDRVFKSVKRRYRNIDIAPNIIIINSIYNPVDFYSKCLEPKSKSYEERCFAIERAKDTEPIKQFLRRITYNIHIDQKNDLNIIGRKQYIIEQFKSMKEYEFDTAEFITVFIPENENEEIIFEIDENHKNLMDIKLKSEEKEEDDDDEFDDFWAE